MTTLSATPQTRGSEAALQRFERLSTTSEPAWVQAVRKAGIAHFSELGFPTIKDEEWQFTPLSPLREFSFEAPPQTEVTAAELEPFFYKGVPGIRLVFINGFFAPKLSSPTAGTGGIQVQPLSAALGRNLTGLQQNLARYARCDDNPFAALNTALFQDGIFIHLPPQQILEHPVQVIFATSGLPDGAAVFPRNLIIAGAQSQAKIVESYVSLDDSRCFTNPVTEILLDEGAVLEHSKIQRENLQSFHIAVQTSHQGRSSNLLTHSISLGAALARNNITALLDGQDIECTLNGLYLTRDTQLVDHHTAIHHAKPHCNSHEFYHGILDGKSQGVFNGKIFVRPDAQKTDAKQTNRNLLLSDDASMNTKPQLEIYADDVKCTHGATIGQLDEESIFYLRARGIGLDRARRMLIHAFASDIVNRISIEAVREELDKGLFDLYERD